MEQQEIETRLQETEAHVLKLAEAIQKIAFMFEKQTKHNQHVIEVLDSLSSGK